jgi:regulatory protein
MGWHSGEGGRASSNDGLSNDEASNDGESNAAADAPTRKPRRTRPEPTPTQRALGLLVRREHSRVELTRKLTARGVEREDAVAAVDKLEAAGWQNDERFAELLVRSRAATGYGPVRIRAELGTHSLGREAVAAAMETAEVDWEAHARDLVRRRFGDDIGSDRDRQRKAADWLLRRGFTLAHVRAATRFDPDD